MPCVLPLLIIALPVPYELITIGFEEVPTSDTLKLKLPLNVFPPKNRIVSPLKLVVFTFFIVCHGLETDVPALASFPNGLM